MPIDPAAVTSETEAADRLYGLPPEVFVAERDQLARDLRAAGQRDLAAQVKGLRRPTMIAAELNRVLREAPEATEDLIRTSRELAAGQQRLLAGEGVDMADLQRRHRASVAVLADGAGRHEPAVHAALEAASLDEALHPQLRSATFATEPSPTRGFDLLGPLAASLPARSTPTGPAAPTPASEPRLRPAPQPGPEPTPQAEPGVQAQPEAKAEPGLQQRPGRRAGPEGVAEPAGAAALRSGPAAGANPPAEPPRRPVAEPGDQAEARRGAVAALARAERQLTALRAAEEQAAVRVADLERRVDEARHHQADTERRRAAAETLHQQAVDTLARLADPTDG